MKLGSIFDGSNSTLYLNNTGQTPVACTNLFGATGTVHLGTNANVDGFLNGDIAEVFITNSAMLARPTAPNIHTYFQTKWFGVTGAVDDIAPRSGATQAVILM